MEYVCKFSELTNEVSCNLFYPASRVISFNFFLNNADPVILVPLRPASLKHKIPKGAK